MLIRVYPVNSFGGGDICQPGAGLSGIIRAIVAVRDLDHARSVAYETGFALACDAPREDDARGVRGFVCRPPFGRRDRVREPKSTPDRPFARDVASFLDDRDGLYALVLRGDERRSFTVCGARIIVERNP